LFCLKYIDSMNYIHLFSYMRFIDEDRSYALGCAASRGHDDVMKLLLDRPDD